MKIGQWIKKQRILRGLSQAALAERLSVTPSAVTQWERGMTTPHRLRLVSLSTHLGPMPNLKRSK